MSEKWRPFCLGINVHQHFSGYNELTWIHTSCCDVYDATNTVYPKKYAHGFVVLCFVVVTQSFIMNSHEVIIHIHQGCFAGTGAIVRLPQCQWSKPDGYGKISQCITTTKHSKSKTVCIFLGIYCRWSRYLMVNFYWNQDRWYWSVLPKQPNTTRIFPTSVTITISALIDVEIIVITIHGI